MADPRDGGTDNPDDVGARAAAEGALADGSERVRGPGGALTRPRPGNARDVLESIARQHVPDPRLGVCELRLEEESGRRILVGETTSPAAVEQALRELQATGQPAPEDAVVRLPDPALGAGRAALVRSAVASVHPEPRVSAPMVSQYVMGHRLDVLSRREGWWRCRGEDGYVGWVHDGHLLVGEAEWAREWETGAAGEPAVSLGTIVLDEDDRPLGPLPWGARLIRDTPRLFRLPDGRRGHPRDDGDVIPADRLSDRFPIRGESVARTARTWWGTPYLWGGVTPAGADCSGYVQSVFWMHGIALPRDSDLQAKVGQPLDTADLAALRPGDLLFFAEGGERITHVALSLGGAEILHSALSNGAVRSNRLDGVEGLERRLAAELVEARRVLPDPERARDGARPSD